MTKADFFTGILGNLLAMLFGFVVGLLFQHSRNKIKAKIRIKAINQRYEQQLPSFTAKWLQRYYFNNDKLDNLFLANWNGKHTYISILTKDEWHNKPINETDLLSFTRATELRKANIRINEKLIMQRTQIHPMIWNGNILCVNGVDSNKSTPSLNVGYCQYFEYLTVCGSLEEETYNAVTHSNAKTPLRDKYALDIDTMSRCRLKAHGLGMQVALLYRQGNTAKVLIQERNPQTVMYGGALAVAPAFACQPVTIGPPYNISLFHNFLREFYEELYAQEILSKPSKHLDQKWFYREKPIAKLLELKKQNKFHFEILGFGFDALNGEGNIAAFALIDDEDYFNEELANFESNWEAKSLKFIDIDSPYLVDAINSYQFQPGSAFALSKSRSRFDEFFRRS